MKRIKCESCGAVDLKEKDGILICSYCGSKFAVEREEAQVYNIRKNLNGSNTYSYNTNSSIALREDVQRLLDKCKKEPTRAKRYANLILDIDPDNREALKYL